MKSSLRLLRIGGIQIGVHYTWILIFVLVSWTLAQGYFPQVYPQWDTATYWITGGVAALLLFVSVLLHELAHSFVAKARGMSVNSITLFILGGVSNLEEEPAKPGIEFIMSVVGPLTSLALAGAFWGLLQLVPDRQTPLAAILGYLALINAVLAVFNLLPGFPLDGGRVLRSIVWGATGDLVKATNVAATLGRVFGWALIIFGLFQLLGGNFIGGIWLAFIGWFLGNAADASRREITLREHLGAVLVREILKSDPRSIGPDATVAELVTNIFRRYYDRAVPVCQNDRILGIVTITDVRDLSQEKWSDTRVGEIMTRQPLYTVGPEDDLNTALKLITRHDINQVLVSREGMCAGLINRADIIAHLQMSQELGLKRR